MQTILAQSVRGRVQQLGDLFGRGKCGEEFGQERVLAAPAGFDEDLAGGRALVVQSFSEADPQCSRIRREGYEPWQHTSSLIAPAGKGLEPGGELGLG